MRRSEKLALVFKRATVIVLIAAGAAALVIGARSVKDRLLLEDIVVTGTYHLDTKDIMEMMKVRRGDSLVDLRFSDMEQKLKRSPWIKEASLRKQYPGTLVIRIDEASPKALLSRKKELYLLDQEGNILEKIQGDTVPFLPILKEIDPKDRKAISEAMKLVGVLSGHDSFADRESLEIGIESYGLTMNMDGEMLKVGYGQYPEKLARWAELEPEIRKRGVSIKYVDLRFKDSVIVKPLKPVNGGPS